MNKRPVKQVKLTEIIANVMGYVCYGSDKNGRQYVQCKPELLKAEDFEYFKKLGAEAKKFNEYRIRFWFPDNVKIIENEEE